MATGQGFTNAREIAILNGLKGTAITVPAANYVGLMGAAQWVLSTVYTINTSWVCSTTTSQTRLFRCTTGGTSNTTIPAAFATATDGQVITDNTATWTEGTMRFDAAVDGQVFPLTAGPVELSGSGYARIIYTQASWTAPAATGGTTTGSSMNNSTAITFAAANANWVPVCGFFIVDALTLGNYWFWARLSNQLQINNTQQAQFNAAGLIIGVD